MGLPLPATLAALALPLLLACGPARPDLVLVTFDTLRLDHVGAYAPPASGGSLTPHLDALAARGLRFERAFTPMPTTAPAHASLFTGLHPREHGVERNGDQVVPEHAGRALSQRLRGAGYATGAFVTSGVFRGSMGLPGFEIWDAVTEPFRPGADAASAALDWLDRAPRPVFLWLHLYDPHAPYGPSERKLEAYPVDLDRYGWVGRERYADVRERFQMTYAYGQGVRDADRALGRLVEGLAERGREPLWVVTADHGEHFDEQLEATGFAYSHGALLADEVLRVPLVIAGPGVEPGVASAPVTLRDLYTTLLSAAGIEDAAAPAEDRLDLLGALPERRVVGASRRLFEGKDARQLRLGENALTQLRAHAAAASDGDRWVVVGVDGEPLAGSPGDAALLEAARERLAADLAARGERRPTELDEETRAALRALGYVD